MTKLQKELVLYIGAQIQPTVESGLVGVIDESGSGAIYIDGCSKK